MKNYLKGLLILLSLVLIAMGSMPGESSPDRIPVTEKNYRAVFTDNENVTTECRNVSIDGNTYIEGKRGSGSQAIAFDHIKQIVFHVNGEKMTAKLELVDGTALELYVKKSSKAFGMTRHGTFQITIIDLARITFKGLSK